MNIALIGYGKMGKAIEEIALQRGHTIVLKIDVDNADQFTKENLAKLMLQLNLQVRIAHLIM
jgi:4-hydroxy-tetrahydrodipicolinate reductase